MWRFAFWVRGTFPIIPPASPTGKAEANKFALDGTAEIVCLSRAPQKSFAQSTITSVFCGTNAWQGFLIVNRKKAVASWHDSFVQ